MTAYAKEGIGEEISVMAEVLTLRREDGQMAVECAVVLPVMMAIAFVVMNALVFVGDCIAFDIAAREAVCLQADDGYDDTSAVSVQADIERRLGKSHIEVFVKAERIGNGHIRYNATLVFHPPFLGNVSVFGLSAPPLRHEVAFTVSPYRKGVLV